MARLSPARRAALALVGERRRRGARIREVARSDASLEALSAADRALAFRLAVGATATEAVLDELVDALVRRPSSLEPRVRDALRVATYEICYLDTPAAVAASQGVELVRSASPRAVGLANAVLRRIARETRPRLDEARRRMDAGEATAEELALAAGLPRWLVERVCAERGQAFATSLCRTQTCPPPVHVAANARTRTLAEVERALADAGMSPRPIEGLPGSFALSSGAELAASPLVGTAALAVADVSSQLVCRLSAPAESVPMLEVGQGRGTKSLLLATTSGAVWPSRIEAVDSVPYKVRLSRERMEAAGLAGVVGCHELDARLLATGDIPPALAGPFPAALLDAPCSGTGTMRRHPEIAPALSEGDVAGLAKLQAELLAAVATRIAPGGVLSYATCSVLRAEDEDVVAAFLGTEAGRDFAVEPVTEAPACRRDAALAQLVAARQTDGGYFLAMPEEDGGDGHFCARLRRVRG